MPRLLVIAGSTRPTTAGRPVARWIADLAQERGGFEVAEADLGKIALPFLDEPELPATGTYLHQHTKDWSATVSAADAVVLVMPMYNGGFTAPVKNALDTLYHEWKGLPLGVVSYTAGPSGGAPAVAMLRPVLDRLGLRTVEPALSLPGIRAEGFTAAEEQTAGARALLDALAAAVAEAAAEPAAQG
ncbi:NAD(P)H-dependent oxidoreductase [Streptomyces sp. NPDC097619]|uniref:NADPH-dependent FMN reductase n=1 Tax=Streptomyces sp. NPDC097619 TaxID=3157228 RepID=UPI003327534C